MDLGVQLMLHKLVTLNDTRPIYIVYKKFHEVETGTCPKCKGKKYITKNKVKYICSACLGSGKRKEWRYDYLVTKFNDKNLRVCFTNSTMEVNSVSDVRYITNSLEEAKDQAATLNEIAQKNPKMRKK